MAITRIDGGLWVGLNPAHNSSAAGIATAATLSASAHKAALCFPVPKTGTLDLFEVRLGTVSNTPDNGMRFSFQDLDASGNPDGTQDQFRDVTSGFTSNTWLAPPGVMTNDGTNGGSKRSVTAGQMMACVIEFVSFTASDNLGFSGLQLTTAGSVQQVAPLTIYRDVFAAAWTKDVTAPLCIALKYNDGYYPIGPEALPILTVNTRTYNSGSTPDERALRFQVPFACEIDAVKFRMDLDGACDIVLYDSSSSVLTTTSLATSARSGTNGADVIVPLARTSLSANTTYRIAVKPTSVTNLSLETFDVNSNGLFACMHGGIQWYESTRTDAGAWSDTTTARPWAAIRLSGIDISTGGAGGAFTFIG